MMRTSFYVNPGLQRTKLGRDVAVAYVSDKVFDLGYRAKVYPAVAIRDTANNFIVDGCVVEMSVDDNAIADVVVVENKLVRLGIGLRKTMSDFPIYLLLETKGDPVFAFRRTVLDTSLDKMADLWYGNAKDVEVETGIFVSAFIHQVDNRQIEINGFSHSQCNHDAWKKTASQICVGLDLGKPKFVNRRVLQFPEHNE